MRAIRGGEASKHPNLSSREGHEIGPQFLFLTSLLCVSAQPQSKTYGDSSEVIGTWEGQSKRTIPDSPCHDEHVIYEIAPDKDKATTAP